MSATQGTPRRRNAWPIVCADSGGDVVSTQSNGCSRWAANAARRANGVQATASGSGTISLLSGWGLPL